MFVNVLIDILCRKNCQAFGSGTPFFGVNLAVEKEGLVAEGDIVFAPATVQGISVERKSARIRFILKYLKRKRQLGNKCNVNLEELALFEVAETETDGC